MSQLVVTNNDIRQLAIHFATVLRNPAATSEDFQVCKIWSTWPKDVWCQFYQLVTDELKHTREPFWVHAAAVNNTYGRVAA